MGWPSPRDVLYLPAIRFHCKYLKKYTEVNLKIIIDRQKFRQLRKNIDVKMLNLGWVFIFKSLQLCYGSWRFYSALNRNMVLSQLTKVQNLTLKKLKIKIPLLNRWCFNFTIFYILYFHPFLIIPFFITFLFLYR